MAKVNVVLLKTNVTPSSDSANKISKYLNDGYVIDKMTTVGQWHNEVLYVFVRHNQIEED